MYYSLLQGVNELLDEGAVQMLRDRNDDGAGLPILAAVGQLQFEVYIVDIFGLFLLIYFLNTFINYVYNYIYNCIFIRWLNID